MDAIYCSLNCREARNHQTAYAHHLIITRKNMNSVFHATGVSVTSLPENLQPVRIIRGIFHQLTPSAPRARWFWAFPVAVAVLLWQTTLATIWKIKDISWETGLQLSARMRTVISYFYCYCRAFFTWSLALHRVLAHWVLCVLYHDPQHLAYSTNYKCLIPMQYLNIPVTSSVPYNFSKL